MSETCRVIINQVKQKLHLFGYLPIQYYKDARYHEHKIQRNDVFAVHNRKRRYIKHTIIYGYLYIVSSCITNNSICLNYKCESRRHDTPKHPDVVMFCPTFASNNQNQYVTRNLWKITLKNFQEKPFGWTVALLRGWTHKMTVGSDFYFSPLLWKGAQNDVYISRLLHCSRKSCVRRDKVNKTYFLILIFVWPCIIN